MYRLRYSKHVYIYRRSFEPLIYAFNLPDPVTLGGAYDGSLQGHVIVAMGGRLAAATAA